MSRPAVLVVGRNGLTRDIVEHLLRAAGHGAIDLRAVEHDEVDVIVVVVEPGESEWAVVASLGAKAVVVTETTVDDARLLELIAQGAAAVVDAAADVDDVLHAVEAVSNGHAHMTPRQTAIVLDAVRPLIPAAPAQAELTPREREILHSIAIGASVKQTARALAISEKTVQNLQAGLFRKLGARNRAHAVELAHARHLL
jgi:DNA-binding NarL/FixJ family response regulator